MDMSIEVFNEAGQLVTNYNLDRYIEYGCVIVGDWYSFRSLGTWRIEGGEAVGGTALTFHFSRRLST